MRVTIAIALSALLMGCEGIGLGSLGLSSSSGSKGSTSEVAETEADLGPYAHLRDPDCYTVDLFDDQPIERPGDTVPPEVAQYVGLWENGAWDGTWCHDLLVFRAEANGQLHLLDMHAPNTDLNLAPTVFRRTARVDEEGNLRFRYGTESRVYRIKQGVLYGVRTGGYGRMEIALSNPNVVPFPQPRPVRAARN